MLTLLLVSSFLVTCSARAANDVAAQPRNIGRDPMFKRVCYYTNWSQYRKQPARFFPFNIDPFLCTHLIFAFAKIDFKGQLAPYEWNDIQYPHLYKQFTGLKKKNPHLKTLLAVGGWTHGSRPFTDMVKTPEGRKSFIEQSIQYLRAHNFDGIDLDWEYPANRGSPADDKKKFSLLVMELRDAYEQEAVRAGKERLLVTAAVAGGEKIVKSAYEVPVINKYLDFINLMSYDLNGAWSKVLGINAPLYKSNTVDPAIKSTSVDEVVQLWLDLGATRDKLVMGIPTYGRSFTLCSEKDINVGDKNCGAGRPSPFTREKGFVSYYEMSKYLQQDWTRVWLEDQMVPYAYNLRLKQWVGYDDIQSVQLKAQYIKHRQLAGAMVWAVDLDDFSNLAGRGEVYPLSKAIRDVLEDADYPAFTPPPKLATTKQKAKSTQRPGKDTYKQEEAVTKKNKSSKFNNLNTVRKSPFKPPPRRTSRTWTSTTATRRPTTHSVTILRRTTTKATPTTVITTPTSQPTTTKPRRSTHRAVISSRRSPYKKPVKLTKLSTRRPSVWQRVTSTSTVSPKFTSTKRTSRPSSRRTVRTARPTRPSYRHTSTRKPFYLRTNPTRPTQAKRVTPSLPPVMSSSPKYPQWVPVVITTKGVTPTKLPALKKSSHDLKINDHKNSLLSRKITPNKNSKDKVVRFGPKPSYRKSPYTPPPSYLAKQASFPGSGVDPSIATKVLQPKWPSKKVINIFQKSTMKTSISSFETVSSPETTIVNVKRVTKPTRVNVVSKPSAAVYEHNLLESIQSTTHRARFSFKPWTRSTTSSTTPSTTTSTSTTTPSTTTSSKPTWRPPYSFKPWSKSTFKPNISTISIPNANATTVENTTETTVSTTTSTTSSSTTSTPLTSTSTTPPSTVTSTTLLSTSNVPRTSRRPRYSFKPWRRTTLKATTAGTTTVTEPIPTTDTGMRAAMFKPKLSAPTMTSRVSTSLPKFRPWTRTSQFTTTPQTPSSTKAFFLFAHLTKKRPARPTTTPSRKQTARPTTRTTRPTTKPTTKPTKRPTTKPITKPTTRPTTTPTTKPTTRPTTKPSTRPTTKPTTKPTRPTTNPTTKPTTRPTTKQTTRSTSKTTKTPSTRPTTRPSTRPTIKQTTRATIKLTTRSTTSTTSPPTTSTSTSRPTLASRRITPRPRPSTKNSRQWKQTATPPAIVKIIKEKTFPMRRTTKASKVVTLPPRRTTPRFKKRHPEIKFTKRGPTQNITSTTPDLRAEEDGGFAASSWSTDMPTAPPTSIGSLSVNLKQNGGDLDSDYRRARKYTSPSPAGPQKIFAWMTAKTTKSLKVIGTTKKATSKPETTPLTTTQSTASPTTTTPTTTTTVSTSTAPTTTSTSAATTRTSTLKRTTHSLMEAGLGLDHTHPNVKFSTLRKGLRKGLVNNRRGMRFFKRPFIRVTPPRLATPPPPTDGAYVLTVPKTSDCDHKNEDIRQPDVQGPYDNQRNQRPLIMNTDYIQPRPKLKKRPHHGFVVENLKDNLYRRQEQKRNNYGHNYKIATKQTRPQRLYSTNVRYHVPSRNSFRQPRPQTGYNIPSRKVTQPQKRVIDYRVPGGKFDTIQQNLEIKAQEKKHIMEATEKENFNKFAIPEFRCPSVFGIFPDRTDCHSFYQCVWFVPFHHMCGKGTVWNDTMKICDWPQAVTTCPT
ncbi:mucin-5AC-like [Haliotis rufescens]|uniref:mucin-5AC-like n=1 Tax=Haliotis rufescens TaxID=6454 RepID=UPI00201F21C1|nr:mucin-5AC-like [Haliotis rufescens]